MALTLYYHPLASYCHKVLIALYERECDFERRIIDLGNADERAQLQALWPLTKFPVLRDSAAGRTVAESSIIIEYIDHHATSGTQLIPLDWERAMEVRLWDRIFDNHVQGPMQEIVADRFRPVQRDLGRERDALATAYQMIETRMQGRSWVAGEFGMADCAAAPALFYASTIVPLPENCPQLQAYFARLMERPSVQRVLAEARPYFSMYPFAEAIPPHLR